MKKKTVKPSLSLFEWMSDLQDGQEKLRHCKIIATIGPSSANEKAITSLIAAGMNVARLNFSHASHNMHLASIRKIRAISKQLGRNVAILQDLQGPKIRCGVFLDDEMEIKKKKRYTLVYQKEQLDKSFIPVDYDNLNSDLKKDDRVFMDDGLLQFKVVEKSTKGILVESLNNGVLKKRKGINFPDSSLSIPSLTDKDKRDLAFGVSQNVDALAVSFVQNPGDIVECRKLLHELGSDAPIIAKIEKISAIHHLDEITKVSDGLMVARGDLGVEGGVEKVPNFQKNILESAECYSKPVIIATQMLESMIDSPRPTLAEVSDVVNGVLDGADCVMLSAETASGKYPVKALEKMAATIRRVESWSLNKVERYHDHSSEYPPGEEHSAIAHASCEAADKIKAKAIVCLTLTGSIARLISRWRPNSLIIAVSPSYDVIRRLSMHWGVYGMRNPLFYDTDILLQDLPELLKELKIVDSGDKIVVTAGIPLNSNCSTNMIKINEIP